MMLVKAANVYLAIVATNQREPLAETLTDANDLALMYDLNIEDAQSVLDALTDTEDALRERVLNATEVVFGVSHSEVADALRVISPLVLATYEHLSAAPFGEHALPTVHRVFFELARAGVRS